MKADLFRGYAESGFLGKKSDYSTGSRPIHRMPDKGLKFLKTVVAAWPLRIPGVYTPADDGFKPPLYGQIVVRFMTEPGIVAVC